MKSTHGGAGWRERMQGRGQSRSKHNDLDKLRIQGEGRVKR